MDNERRVKSRYPLELNVRYQAIGAAGPVAGVGQTVNMSSSGMLLACASNIPEGTRLKVFVEWPSLAGWDNALATHHAGDSGAAYATLASPSCLRAISSGP